MSKKFLLQAEFSPAGHQPEAIRKLCQGLKSNHSFQTMLGVTGSGKTFAMASVIAQSQRPALILAPNKTLAAQLYAEMRRFFPQNAVEYFVSYYDYYQPEAYVAATDTFIEKDSSINEQIEQMRLSATKAIVERSDTIIVASVSAIYGLGDPQLYLEMALPLHKGLVMDQREILKRLAQIQYRRNDYELRRSTYRVHGDVIDIFPADSEQMAIRIELFDDEIEAIRQFDPLTGEVIETLEKITIFPKSHYVTPKERLKNAMGLIKNELNERLAALRSQQLLLEAQRLEQRTRFDLEMIHELGYCSGIENYSRYLSERQPGEPPPTLVDYLPKDAIVFIDESHVTIPQLGGMYRGDRSRKENLVEFGFRLPSALDNRPLRFDEFLGLVKQIICVSATPGDYEFEHSKQIVELLVRPTGLLDPSVAVRPVASQVDDCLSEIRNRVARDERVLITTLTKKMAENLTEYLSEQGVRVRYLHSDVKTVDRVEILKGLRLGEFDVLVGINLLREGLDLPEVSLVAIFDADKEGFLRSARSLIQTIGRAARNARGSVILYANRITGSMERAIDETNRRREIQEAYNLQHGITPKSIIKDVDDAMSLLPQSKDKPGSDEDAKSTDISVDYDMSSPQSLARAMDKIEKEMYLAAEQLEFEHAAELRDQLSRLKQVVFKHGAS